MTAEYIATEKPDHTFNLINRDQRTPIFEPEKWNRNSLVVDAWAGSVYTKKGFCIANARLPYYDISNNVRFHHIIPYFQKPHSKTYQAF
jgi:hypothetical protein